MTDITATLVTAINRLITDHLSALVGGEYLRQVVIPQRFAPGTPITVPAVIEVGNGRFDLPLLKEENGIKHYLFQVAGPVPLAVTLKVHPSCSEMLNDALFEEHRLVWGIENEFLQFSKALDDAAADKHYCAQLAQNILAKRLTLRPGMIDPHQPDPEKVRLLQGYLDAGWEVTVAGGVMPKVYSRWEVTVAGGVMPKVYSRWWHLRQLGEQLPAEEIKRRVMAMLEHVRPGVEVRVMGSYLHLSVGGAPPDGSMPRVILVFPDDDDYRELEYQFLSAMGDKLPFDDGQGVYHLMEDGVKWVEVAFRSLVRVKEMALFQEDLLWLARVDGGYVLTSLDGTPCSDLAVNNIKNNRLHLLPNMIDPSVPSRSRPVNDDRIDQVNLRLLAGYQVFIEGVNLGPSYCRERHVEILKAIGAQSTTSELDEIQNQLNIITATFQSQMAALTAKVQALKQRLNQ